MTMINERTRTTGRARAAAGFTLAELLVAMGIIAVLAAVTVVAVRGISKDARLSSGKNTLIAALGEARALAMKRNEIILVTFRAKWDPENPKKRQKTQIILARWEDTVEFPVGSGNWQDRFVPLEDVLPRELPAGIKVAGPWYDRTLYGTSNAMWDFVWITQPELAKIDQGNPGSTGSEQAGRYFGLMYAPDGSILLRNPSSGNKWAFLDFDRDGFPSFGNSTFTEEWAYDEVDDETLINPVPFLAVYDDDAARELRTADWTTSGGYEELTGSPQPGSVNETGLISRLADRIHFNRYTGVVMK
jgi:prepilin-type N-terminal cleavage/methylation domain-containing protein